MDTKWFNELYDDAEGIIVDYKWEEATLAEVDDAIDKLVLQARLDRTREILELLNGDGKYMSAALYLDGELAHRYPKETDRAIECPLLDENGEYNDGRV